MPNIRLLDRGCTMIKSREAYFEQMYKMRNNVYVGASAMGDWYKVAGVHGGGSPIMETIALNAEYDYADKKKLARYLAGIDEDLDDSRILSQEPASLDPNA